MKVHIPIKTVSVANLREHHMARAKRAKQHRHTAWLAMKAAGPPPAPPLTVTMTRQSIGTLDTDNLASSIKSARDGIADWLGLDDGDTQITWRYAQEKAKRGVFGLIVEVL